MSSNLKKNELLQISANLELISKKSETCFELYDNIINRTQEIAKYVVSKLEYADLDIVVFGFSYYKGRYNDYLMYDSKMLCGYTDHRGGGFDGGDFNFWIPQTSESAIFECAHAIEKGLINDVLDFIDESIASRELLLNVLNESTI